MLRPEDRLPEKEDSVDFTILDISDYKGIKGGQPLKGLCQGTFFPERTQSFDKSSKIILEKFFEKHRKLKIS